MEEIDYLGTKINRWQIGASTFLAAPTLGARLMNWNINLPDGGFRDVIHWPELKDIDGFVKARGGNPILFPFSARTFDKGDIGFWTDPTGTRRPMPMHGFARDGVFETTVIDKRGFTARLVPDRAAQEAFPYQYDFDVIYRFSEKKIIVEFKLSNRDTQPIPWSAGHHFYFNLPWVEGTSRKDYELSIPARKACRQNTDGSLAPLPDPDEKSLISNGDLVDCIHYELQSTIIRCTSLQDDSIIEIEIGTTELPNPEYALVTWTETPKSPFFCIEPWMGPPNSPENKIGLHTVPPGESRAFSITVRV